METDSTSALALDDGWATGDRSGDSDGRRQQAQVVASERRGLDGLFEPGRNCWRVARAERVGVLVDGEEYYGAVRRSMTKAGRRIYIAGWDLHSQLELVRGPTHDDLPTQLADLLIALLERNPELDVYVLLWDFASIYALEREPLFLGDNPWESHPRLHFCKDDKHPLTASQHQKLVAIDGAIAYCGGFDLSKWRWDSNDHAAQDDRRIDTDGEPYPPFHDLQMLVDGEAAAAVNDMLLDRWYWATGIRIAPPKEAIQEDAWPDGVPALLRDQEVAIARTLSAFEERPEVREIERLYLDSIARAQHLIYFENQYLTSRSVGDALCASLEREQGPEIIIVLPQRTGAWLEQHTMDTLRARMLERLREADEHGRLRVYYPDVVGLEEECLMVHAKLTIADDKLLRIGSSNLSNRSMGLDSECDASVLGETDEAIAAIRGLRHRLLGIFLAADAERVGQVEAEARERGEGFIQALETLREERAAADAQPHIRLGLLDDEIDPEWDRQLPDERIVDPDRPIDTDLVTDVVVGGEEHVPHVRWRLILGVGLIVLFVGLAAAWRWTALGEWLDPSSLASALKGLSGSVWGPPVAVLGFVAAAVAAVPVTLLILATAIVFGPFMGATVALTGSLLSALAGYGIGGYLGRSAVERMVSGGLERLRKRLRRYGVVTVVTVRVVPVAPFAVINLFAGASHLRLRDFMIGTAIGMAPAILATSVFAEGLMSLISKADLRAVALVLVGALAVVGLAWYGRRMLAADD
ncbi:VTT domain-containing protein [Thiorhodococcus minor]|uniref:Phosphatidylserine/phosphatidylglycerophosphate/ cardiolipin synthase n=1 Tax=Thiorhodococcus minor TaxID=57489 RepID=A0A6M0JXM3_9GAMM|nr:VTT domain-containing protein [Thiorhodococcus minor]NEV61383.1 phosphatidylserine/phosphatidylglycerophosphate/cardiolipin synthase [Thiorhodococcus minor]